MEIISASSNQHAKALRALYTKKGRQAAGMYVVEGQNIVKDIPSSVAVQAYYFAASRYEQLRYVVKDENAAVYVVQDALLERIVDTVTPSGVVAVLPIPTPTCDWRLNDRLLVLDGVSDPGNVGTLLRTALAAGYNDVVMIGGADPFSPKVVRASMGGVYQARVWCLDYPDLDSDHQWVVLDMQGQDVFAFCPAPRYAVVVGSEASGVSPTVLAKAHKCVSIPMQQGMESLNAAVAGAIGMYVLRHNAASNKQL